MSTAISERTEGDNYGQVRDAADDSTFPGFARLPPEIRRMIWLTVAQIPRTIELRLRSRYFCKLGKMFGMRGVMFAKWLGDTTPAILHATRESRSVALEVFTALHFELHETTIRTPITLPKDLYANLDLDVFYLQINPRITNKEYIARAGFMIAVRSLFIDTFNSFRRLRFDIREIWDEAMDEDEEEPPQKAHIKSFLVQAWYFSSSVEFIEFVCDEDADHLSTEALIRDALGELVDGYGLLVDIEFFQVRDVSRSKWYINRTDECEVIYPAVRIYFPPETREAMIVLSQS